MEAIALIISKPALSAHCKIAVEVKLFQHLKDAGEVGLSADDLARKTGVVSFSNDRFLGSNLSDGLAAENYQKSIDFCYDVARPSFNRFPDFFKKADYKSPTSPTDGPFQMAHGTQLPFFPWLEATPPHLDEFGNFMSAYRAGKANWFDPGFYPVADRLIEGFNPANNEVLLVDVGGGRGHDVQQFVAQYKAQPGKAVLQDLEPVIASIQDKNKLPFDSTVHDFFTPQPIKAARAYQAWVLAGIAERDRVVGREAHYCCHIDGHDDVSTSLCT